MVRDCEAILVVNLAVLSQKYAEFYSTANFAN